MSKLSDFFKAIGHALSEGWHEVVADAEPGVDLLIKNGGKILTQSAFDAAAAANNTSGTGKEKFEAAVAAVIKDLTTAGIPVVMNAVNLAIELAVAKLRALQQ